MASAAPAPAPPMRPERSRLLPHNRRLRHLHGISLRHLALSAGSRRPRGYTIDDDALPNTTRSPSKLLALREEQHITKTRSSGNLRDQGTAARASAAAVLEEDAAVTVTVTTPKKSIRPRPRRQSTLDISSPAQRKLKEADTILEHLADVFFSLHVPSASEPIYVSEVVPNTMNPEFRFFDLSVCAAHIARSDHLIVKLWARHILDRTWLHVQDAHLDLRYLTLVTRSVDQLLERFPENSVLLHFSDGIYSLPDAATAQTSAPPAPLPLASSMVGPSETTSSYDALMRLQTLDSCIADALESRDKLIAEINELVTSPKTSTRFRVPTEVAVARDSLTTTRRHLEAALKTNKATSTANATSSHLLTSRKHAMREGRLSSERARLHLSSASDSLTACKATHEQTLFEITGQRRRIASELQDIFPIEPLPNIGDGSVFAIRGAALPANSDFSNLSPYTRPAEAEISAALGHASHLVRLLSLYMSIPLPYPVVPRSSLSAIQDPISIMPQHQSRTFPLYLGKHVGAGGVLLYRFEYGVFLLNKNIEVLMTRSGTRAMDIRQTLANLGLLLFAVAGGGQPGEVPPRFRGAVKGLALRKMDKRPSWHRSNSRDDASDVSSEFEATLAGRRGSASDNRPWLRDGNSAAAGTATVSGHVH